MRPLVDSLLVLARADAGQLELQYEPCDLSAIVKDCAALVEPLAAQRAITLQLDLQPTPLSADAFRLTQVVANLLTNAILYNQPQGHVIVVLTSQSDEIMLTVADNGIGIPAQHLPRIFDRFFRVEESRSRELGGAGLGLSITKSIIEAHHGTITATSEPGNGATFRVRLPAHP
jgi:signal transduction histidine kinase